MSRHWKNVPNECKTLIAFGAGLVGVGSSIGSLIPTSFQTSLIVGGLAVIGSGVSGLAIATANNARTSGAPLPQKSSLAAARIYLSYRPRCGGIEEVDQVLALDVGLPELPPAERVKSRMLKCPNLLTVIERVDEAQPRLAGYSTIYPLNKDVCRRIIAGSVFNGSSILESDLCQNYKSAAGLYIGGVNGSVSGIDRTATLIYFYERLCRILENSPKVNYLFARPLSKQGRYWMLKVGFKQIDPSKTEIWILGAAGIKAVFHAGQGL